MNMRIAKKVLGNKSLDSKRKPSEQTSYNDEQIAEAHRRYRLSFRRWQRCDPAFNKRAKWLPRDPLQPRSAWEAGQYLYRDVVMESGT